MREGKPIRPSARPPVFQCHKMRRHDMLLRQALPQCTQELRVHVDSHQALSNPPPSPPNHPRAWPKLPHPWSNPAQYGWSPPDFYPTPPPFRPTPEVSGRISPKIGRARSRAGRLLHNVDKATPNGLNLRNILSTPPKIRSTSQYLVESAQQLAEPTPKLVKLAPNSAVALIWAKPKFS